MSAVAAGKAVMAGTAIVAISMGQMILTGICLAVGFQIGGVIVDKVRKAIEDGRLAREEEESEEPLAGSIIQ